MGLPFQGHKDNHAGLMTPTQMEAWRETQNIAPGHEWDKFEGLDIDAREIDAFLARAPFCRQASAASGRPRSPCPIRWRLPQRRRCRRSRASVLF